MKYKVHITNIKGVNEGDIIQIFGDSSMLRIDDARGMTLCALNHAKIKLGTLGVDITGIRGKDSIWLEANFHEMYCFSKKVS